MKKLPLVLSGLFLLFCCSPGSGPSGPGGLGALASAVPTDATQFMESSKKLVQKVTAYGHSSSNELRVLTYLQGSGLLPLNFQTDSGNQVTLSISRIRYVDSFFVFAQYDGIAQYQTTFEGIELTAQENTDGIVLVNLATGAIADYDDVELANVIADEHYIYTTKVGAAYKIDKADITRFSILNNPIANPAGTLLYIIGNKLITENCSIDINLAFPPRQVIGTLVAQSSWQGISQPFSAAIEINDVHSQAPYVFGNDGKLWAYRLYLDNIATFSISIDDDGRTIISDYQESPCENYVASSNMGYLYGTVYKLNGGSRNDGEHTIISKDGYLKVRKAATSGLVFTAGPLSSVPYDFPIWRNGPVLIGDTLCWNGAVYAKLLSLDLATNTLSVLLSDASILSSDPGSGAGDGTPLVAVDGGFIFYKYASATTIDTYFLDIASRTSVKMADGFSDIDSPFHVDY
jgi:hypothetical protein